MFASEIKEAETASFASGPSLNTLVDNMSESDGVSYIYYNLAGIVYVLRLVSLSSFLS